MLPSPFNFPAELPKCFWNAITGAYLHIYVLYRNTQYMKAQMSGKICSFKLIKTFFFFFFFLFCVWTCRVRGVGTVLQLLLFAEVAPHFPNESLEKTGIWTWKLKRESEDWSGEQFDVSVWRATLWIRSEKNWNVSCCNPAFVAQEKQRRRLWGERVGSGFPHDTDTQRWEGNGCGAGFRLNMKTERPYMKDRAKDKDKERKGSLMSQHSGSLHVQWCLHVSKNKVLGTSVTEVRGVARSIKISHLEKKWCWSGLNSSFLVIASLQGLMMTSEADEGSSSDIKVSAMFWWHQVILTLGRRQSSWSNDGDDGDDITTTQFFMLCIWACVQCVHVCVWLCMRGGVSVVDHQASVYRTSTSFRLGSLACRERHRQMETASAPWNIHLLYRLESQLAFCKICSFSLSRPESGQN